VKLRSRNSSLHQNRAVSPKDTESGRTNIRAQNRRSLEILNERIRRAIEISRDRGANL
jgi:hypothetical protein